MKIDSFLKSWMKRKQWTILCVEDSGTISSFKLSKNSLIMIGGGVGIAFFVAIAAIIAYATIKVEDIGLRSSLKTVKTELNNTNREKENLMAQLLIMKEGLNSKPKQKDVKPSLQKEFKPLLQQEFKSSLQEGFKPSVDVFVEDFKLRKDPATNQVRYNFILKNKRPRKEAVSGYTFVLLKPVKGDPTSWRASSKRNLENGKPKHFKEGQLFSIARFKIVQGYVKNTESIDYWEEAVVLVYSSSGELILEKVFEYQKRPNTSQ